MIPEYHAWNEHQPAVDEQQFTPWAEPGWLAHNGQSPEVAVCDFVRVLIGDQVEVELTPRDLTRGRIVRKTR